MSGHGGDDARRWARLEEIFHQAAEMSPEERDAFVKHACEGDGELERQVLALLEADRADDAFLATPAARIDQAAPAERDAEWLGGYRLIRPLGRGGMGEVYLGLEEGPDFRRYVAIKVVLDGIGSDFQDRFAQERAILAQLEHPGIARFLGGGTTDGGRPYYVMEYVEGERVDVYCDRLRLSIRERVRLFRKICLAVQHAHQSLVVHRDLKPDNILVTSDGDPKLLDFGIAKLLDGDQAELTRTGHYLATPAYAAPEQLVGGAISTASDVYALGVLLFEILCGQRAFPAASIAERAVGSAAGTTTPPSAAFRRGATPTTQGEATESVPAGELASRRRTTPGALRRTLRGDLDTIVLKAMRSEPAERYVSAAALADDLERYLAGEPVRARPPSFGYRTRKFIGRNRAATIIAGALLLTWIGASLATLAQNGRIRAQAVELVIERDRALEVQSFLLESFGSASADNLAGDTLTVRQVLDGRAGQIDSLYADDPGTRAHMLHVLADGYERLGALAEAQLWAERAVEERRALAAGLRDPELARSVGLLGWILSERGSPAEAEGFLDESLETWRTIGTDSVGLSRALNDLASVLTSQNRLEEAEPLAREAMVVRRAIYPPTHVAIAITANNLGTIVGLQGRYDEALELLEESARVLETTLGPRHRRTLHARRNVAVHFAWLGEWERSAELAAEIASDVERIFGPTDVDLAWALHARGSALGQLARYTAADSALTRGYEIARGRLGDNDLTVSFLTQRSGLYRRMGRPADALARMRDAVAMYRRMYDEHVDLADALRRQGALALDSDERIRSYTESAEMSRRLQGESSTALVRVEISLARALLAEGQFAEALSIFERLANSVPAAFGADHAYAPAPYLGAAEAHLGLGDAAAAADALEAAGERLTGAADVAPNQQWFDRLEKAAETATPD